MSYLRRALSAVLLVLVIGCVGIVVVARTWPGLIPLPPLPTDDTRGPAKRPPPAAPETDAPVVEVDEKGLRLLTIGTVGRHDFKQEIRNLGVIDFNPDMEVPVFPNYQGKIAEAFIKIGDHVEKDQVLYTITSSDLLQAEASLIQAAGVLDLANKNLARLRQSIKNGGGAQKDLDQTISDHQTAVGAFKAAKQLLYVYGKTDEDADQIVASRKVDPVLVVKSPISGTIATRNAAPGLLVQPGTAPAPYTVANLDQVRMYTFVSEDEVPAVRLGQDVTGRVLAYPNREFAGKVTRVAAALDPNTRRLQVESQIADPDHLLRPSMFIDITIRTGAPVRSTAVPTDAVVRLGDGTMTVWVRTGDRRFVQRVVKLGRQQAGFDEILSGPEPGETIVTKNAVFISNVANVNASP